MKCTIPEISWHNREPVLSVDIYPENGQFYRLASGGGDCHVLIWHMSIAANGAVNQEVVSDLTRHQRAVNCVRWSNTGRYLASGDDDANIIIWQLKNDNIPLLEGETRDKEVWIVYKVMRGHKEDVYDICWSVDCSKILSGSVDNTAILWDVNKGKMDHILSDHKGFVQGVAWDPKNQILATISTDRVCRIFDCTGKQVKARIQKGKLTSVPDGHFLKDKDAKYFHDDTFKSFFRRLQFTPDGSLLIVPSGHIEVDNCKTAINATLIFTLDNFSSPAVILPIPRQSSTVVRCCPVLYELWEHGPDPAIKLPYRMIFAVGTDHDIILYDTQQTIPFARFQDIHYTRLTDLTWSQDGLLLIAASTDGFCSLITFEMDELGVPWVKMESETEENPLEISGCEELDKDENVDTSNKDVKKEQMAVVKQDLKEETKKRPSFLEQWALKTPKKRKLDESDKKSVETKKDQVDTVVILDSPVKSNSDQTEGKKKMDVDKTVENKKEIAVNRLIRYSTIVPATSECDSKKDSNDVVVILDSPVKSNSGEREVCGVDKSTDDKKDKPVKRLVPKIIVPVKIENQPKIDKDDTSASPSKTDKINVLIPKRVKPTLTESKPSPGQENADLSLLSDDESTPDSDDELSPEECKEFNRASKNIKEFFNRVPKGPQKASDSSGHDAPKDKINVLIPKRTRSTLIESNPSTSKPQPKAGTSGHRDLTKHTPSDEDSKSSSSDEELHPEELKELHKASEDIKKFFCRVPKKVHSTSSSGSSEAKPIAVKRKPKEESKNESNTVNKHDDAKPIAVRRKPREAGLKKDKVQTKIEEDTKKLSVESKACEELENKLDLDKKTVSDEVNSNKSPNKLSRSKSNTITKKTGEGNTGNEDVVCIEISDSEQYNTTPEKQKTSDKRLQLARIKVSSLVTKKTAKITPEKPQNALLNFLQKTSDKKTKKKKQEKECHIEIILDEVGARDAWSCDAKQGEEENVMKGNKNEPIIIDDDKTEDFCLQLEDSQEACEDNKKKTLRSDCPITEITNDIKTIVTESEEKNKDENKNVEDKKQTSEVNTPKTPRRVKLITLASPSSKPKQK